MNNEEKNKNKSLGRIMGVATAVVIELCILALIVGLTAKMMMLLF